MKGTIKIDRNTRNHATNLGKLGFETRETEGFIEVACKDILGAVTITEDAIKEAVRDKTLLSYRTRVKCNDGKTRFSVPLCLYLGPISCVVVSPEKPPTEPRAMSNLAAEFGL